MLLSHEAWVVLRCCMAAAGFPVVRCVGLFQLQVRTCRGCQGGLTRKAPG